MIAAIRILLGCAAVVAVSDRLGAQMIGQNVTLNESRVGYAESFGTDWAIRGNGFALGFGGPPLLPPFGPQVPSSRIGFGGPKGHFSLFGGQASSSSISSTAASVTSLNGMPASIQDQRLVPFVTGLTPIVGSAGYGPVDSVSNSRHETLRRISESAAALHNAKLQRYLRRAELGVQSGSLRMALSNYRRALAIAPIELRREITTRINSLSR